MIHSKFYFCAALLLLAAGALLLSLIVGTVPLSISQVWDAILGHQDALAHSVVWELRLPRALSGFAIGGLLAFAGVLMQVLLRNPLADPYVMGVSGGAAMTALTALSMGFSGLPVTLAATCGALATTALVFTLARAEGGWTPVRLLLTGVVVASGASAVVSLLLSLSEDTRLRGMLFWLMGDLTLSNHPGPLLGLLLVAVVGGWIFARHLNVLSRGELQAQVLGVPVRGLRIGIFAVSSLLTAAAVTTAGSIGFVGLVTPHLIRLSIGHDHRHLIPSAVIGGGTIVMLADLIGRTAFAPRQLPVGALTALIGVPLFLLLMRRHQATY
jgi:iron complex transport system permease protein